MATDNTLLNPGLGGDTVRDLARQGGSVKTQAVQLDLGGGSANAEVLITAGQQLKAASVPVVLASDQGSLATLDSTDVEYLAVTTTLTTIGDNTVYTPTAGNRIRLHWVYTLNNPASISPALITLSLGGVAKYVTYGVSKRQVDTGPVNGALVINLSIAAQVACTFRLEEI